VHLRRARRKVAQAELPPIPTIPAIPVPSWVKGTLARQRAATVEGLTPEAALHAKRNFRLGVMNGVLFGLVDGLIAPSVVLALFVNRLGGPNVLVGLLPAIMGGGWFLPQMIVATRVQGQRRVMPWYRRSAIIRMICLVTITLSIVVFAAYPPLLLLIFFIFFTIYALAAGVSGIPWLEMVSKVISPRRRGSFFSQRSFWGGVLALTASGLVAAILSERFLGLTFPYNFALLFTIITVVAGAALWSWSAIREPDAVEVGQPLSLAGIFKRGIEAVRTDREYRGFLITRILLALASISDPFFAVYAATVLGAPTELVGLYLAASSSALLLSNFIWGPMADRASNRTLMVVTVIAVSSVYVTALVVPLFRGIVPEGVVTTAFALVFVLGGLAGGSGRIVNNNMLLTIAPPAERASYVGFLNTVLGLVLFVPPLGGALADVVGFEPLFVASLALALMGLLASTRMSATRGY
jgi:hypothetical protein